MHKLIAALVLTAIIGGVIDIYIFLSKQAPSLSHSYQLDIYDDSTRIFQGDRLVGTIPFDSTSYFDKLMISDNQ